ncbi:hypothetical protein ASPNIDRAFT_37479 [Aspergillus niger ATCC 1015]|uniref:Uncharacterized protein n=1 Tax=Aspergillus niger (strain ATCC 1015 / CBS 113.46 / FGSC A1144 / LSHB Ac4 / NCTC 3858a / NRRL 328 / USDA 3528.7) TaxID=380704 RepID=G3Y2C0_ASPNA|nr:hypothetical protein ASPNIDRAFT_37479 [Aspergillus niger ATCC 1015]
MARLAVRQNGSCPADAQWYVCAAGGFKGCCSVDPCTTGVCPDESGSSGSTRSSSSSSSVDSVPATKDGPVTLTTLVQEPATSILSTSSASSSSSSSTPISSSETSTEAPSSVRSTSTASRASSTTMATTTSSTPNQDPTTTLSSTTSTHSSHSTTTQASLATSQGSGTWHPTAALIGGTVAGAYSASSVLESEDTRHLDCYDGAVDITANPSHQTVYILKLHPDHHIRPSHDSRLTYPQEPLPAYHQQQEPDPDLEADAPPSYPTPSYPYKKNRAAELSDTGFYRPRAELPAQSSRELINIPAERRCRWDCDGGDGASDMIVTADGAVLRATIKTVEADSPFAIYDDDARTTTRKVRHSILGLSMG